MMNFPKFSEFKYWFIWKSSGGFDVKEKKDDGTWEDAGTFQPIYETVSYPWIEDWKKYKERPEYLITLNIAEDVSTYANLPKLYDDYITGCMLLRAYAKLNGGDPDEVLPQVNRLLAWLKTTDFYVAPASSQYHESIPQGLLIHSLKTAAKTHELLMCESFENCSVGSALLVALIHDWCKIGNYEQYMRNVKDEATGKWNQVPSYRTKDKKLSCFGHGVSSMYLAAGFINLSLEESLAIRWHQGRWNVCREEMNELQQANENYPLVHLIQFADQLAIVNY